MGAIPTSDMPGHKQLHERVVSALDRCQESQAVDFKESAPWAQLKWRVIRTVMAMTNLRDGGVIVIGVSEREEDWNLTGIKDDDLASYDVDDIIDIANKYASPPLSLDVVRVAYTDGTQFLAIQVREFEVTPCVCKRNGPDGSKSFRQGDVYIRPPGKAQTKKVSCAEEMHDLLELAAEKRARRMIETSRRIRFESVAPEISPFEEELEGL